jgi:hypothetical protein
VDVQARRREATERCPYCHDVIVDATDLARERITCAGCGTTHHEACLAELGRCTVRGCEREVVVARTPEVEARLAARSAVYREVQRRIRARVRGFVRDNCRPASDRHAVDPVTRIDDVLRAAEAARRDGRWLDAAAAFEEVVRRISDLPAQEGSVRLDATAADARAQAVAMRSQSEGLVSETTVSLIGRIALCVLAACFLLWVAALVAR